MQLNTKYYQLGHYVNGDTSRPHIQQNLLPMTHEQACAMKSKYAKPENVFLHEVALQAGAMTLDESNGSIPRIRFDKTIAIEINKAYNQ